MSGVDRWKPVRLGRGLRIVAVLLAGLWIGAHWAATDHALADNRRTPKQQAFLSGSERSETVLREIATILKRIDKRLEHIESLATKGQRRIVSP